MKKAFWKKHILNFTQNRGTSRGVLKTKPSYFLILQEDNKTYIGECGILPSLSYDDKPEYEEKLDEVVRALNHNLPLPDLNAWPSIKCGVEMLLLHKKGKSLDNLFDTPFTRENKGIEINGLIWMADEKTMLEEIKTKLKSGFTCIKLKIGAIDFDSELSLLKFIRKHYSSQEVIIRVDANGAFSANEALEKLNRLAPLEIHSIEQPIRQGQWQEMAQLCLETPIPIALDEELIGLTTFAERLNMIQTIKPQAIILKPSLVGGFEICDEWIDLAQQNNAFWWATSALESNIGLNAIAQYTASKNPEIAQGLGTGMLYENNVESPLEIVENKLFYNPEKNWKTPFLNEEQQPV